MSPYIVKTRRVEIDEGDPPQVMGELTYVYYKLALAYIADRGQSFQSIGEAVGALEATKQELYRRVGGPYEDQKLIANGDVIG